jgi:hypothetical protein
MGFIIYIHGCMGTPIQRPSLDTKSTSPKISLVKRRRDQNLPMMDGHKKSFSEKKRARNYGKENAISV